MPSLPPLPFQKVLIANRGEIAIRIARAAAELGMRTVGLYATDDAGALHWRRTDEAVALEQAGSAAYLDMEAVIEAARQTGCDAVHPGYGFLSESAAFARRCAQAGLAFVGPSPETLDLLGDKARARQLALDHGVPIAAGLSRAVSLEEAQAFLRELGAGSSVMIKAIAGGGGRGMRVVGDPDTMPAAYAAARSEAKAAFGSDEVYVEALIVPARHIEVQLIGDAAGQVAHLHERECSLQRRQQKLIEFAPALCLPPELRARMTEAAVRLGRAAGVQTLCTMEFLVGADGGFFFMEANPRLQVEHTVTEAVLGIDLVQAQFRLAAGETLDNLGLGQPDIPAPRGLAVQVRVNMERIDPQGMAHATVGRLTSFEAPGGAGVRVDTCARGGWAPSARFDSLLAKLIVHVPTARLEDLLLRTRRALAEFRIEGVQTNRDFLRAVLADTDVTAGRFDTRFVERHGQRLAQAMERLPRPAEEPACTPEDRPGGGVAVVDVPDGAVAVVAPSGGTLVRMAVAPGDGVQQGQLLCVIESMKMEHAVLAPASGIVLALLAESGQSVPAGDALVFLRPQAVDRSAQGVADPEDDALAAQRLETMRDRKSRLLDGAREAAVARQRQRRALTARERLARLCDHDSFVEIGSLVAAEGADFAPADALIVGHARIDGRPVVVLSQDFTVLGGSNGPLGRSKMVRALQMARINGMPVVQLLDGGGHRIQEGQSSRSYASSTPVFQEFARLSGWVPMVSAVMGVGFAGNTNFCAMADLVIMVRGQSEMGLAGPALVKAGTGETITGQALGGAAVQVDRNGLADLAVDNEASALDAIRRFLALLPSNARAVPPPADQVVAPDAARLSQLVPANTRKTYDMREVVAHIADTGSVFEIKPTHGTNIVTSLGRLDGRAVGFIGNQPLVRSGMIDSPAAEKAARFIGLCDAFGLPLIYLIDVPGMSIGSEAERSLLGRRSAKMLHELGHATVPRASVVLRKGYGLGYVAMCGGRGFEPDACLAWPTAEICAMSIEGSVDVAFRKQFQDAPDPAARRQELIEEIRARIGAVQAAEGFGIDDVIEPAQTRQRLIATFAQAPARRQSSMPPKFRSIAPI